MTFGDMMEATPEQRAAALERLVARLAGELPRLRSVIERRDARLMLGSAREWLAEIRGKPLRSGRRSAG